MSGFFSDANKDRFIGVLKKRFSSEPKVSQIRLAAIEGISKAATALNPAVSQALKTSVGDAIESVNSHFKEEAAKAIDAQALSLGTHYPEIKTAVESAIDNVMQASLSEDVIVYVYRFLDRQISKSTGLLSYNGLLLATLNLISGQPVMWPASVFITAGRISALLAALLVLPLLFVKWGKVEEYASVENDLISVVTTLAWRTRLVTTAILLSLATTILTGAALFWNQLSSLICHR